MRVVCPFCNEPIYFDGLDGSIKVVRCHTCGRRFDKVSFKIKKYK